MESRVAPIGFMKAIPNLASTRLIYLSVRYGKEFEK